MKYSVMLFLAGTLSALGGCATTTPAPRELVAARASFDSAQRGPAGRFALVDLHTARRDLERAENAYLNDPSSDNTRDLAYIAERHAELANARGQELQAQQDRQIAERQAQQVQAQQLQNAQSTVRTTQTQLANTQSALRATGQQVQQTQSQLANTQDALAAEQVARQNAEREAQAAMASLRQLSNVREEQRGLVITLSGEVLFTPGEAVLLPIAQQQLDRVATALKDQGRHLTVEGHTDSRGSIGTNQALSLSRAQAVRSYLISKGVDVHLVDAVGLGPSRPVADNRSAEGRASNRRVEIVVAPAAAH
jgi:outer membrane protein OmpA-like peptidoglycan-associated protein